MATTDECAPGGGLPCTDVRSTTEGQRTVVVAGHVVVDPGLREAHLAGCLAVVEQARRAPGCLDSVIAAALPWPGTTWRTRGP